MPGDIAQGGTLQLPFAERARRLAFEIKDDEIFPGIKSLPEMIIAVDPDLGRGRAVIENALFLREDFLFRGQNFLRLRPEGFGKARQFLLEQGKRAPQRRAHVLINGTLRERVERLRRKGAIVRIGSEREMQFAGARSRAASLFADRCRRSIPPGAVRRARVRSANPLSAPGPARNNGRPHRA